MDAGAGYYVRGLCLAVFHGELDLIQELLDAGADANRCPNYPSGEVFEPWNRAACNCDHLRDGLHHCLLGMSALAVACAHRRDERVAKLLVEHGATFDAVLGEPPCHAAARYGRLRSLKWLLDGAGTQKNYDGKTLLHSACDGGDASVVELLLNQGFDARELTGNGWTPLAISCRRTFLMPRNSLYQTEQLRLAEELIAAGADVNAVGPSGETPLCLAIQCGNTDLAKYLVQSGADVDAEGPFGKSPLCLAIQCGSSELANYLFEFGAHVVNTLVVTKVSRGIITSLIKRMDLESQSKLEIESADRGFREQLLRDFGIIAKRSMGLNFEPYDDVPALRFRRGAPMPERGVYVLECRDG